eukprot:6203935-Pleurochrysis_carterae.AAC.2
MICWLMQTCQAAGETNLDINGGIAVLLLCHHGRHLSSWQRERPRRRQQDLVVAHHVGRVRLHHCLVRRVVPVGAANSIPAPHDEHLLAWYDAAPIDAEVAHHCRPRGERDCDAAEQRRLGRGEVERVHDRLAAEGNDAVVLNVAFATLAARRHHVRHQRALVKVVQRLPSATDDLRTREAIRRAAHTAQEVRRSKFDSKL